ncbi:MAG: DNA repair protein RecO [Desulfobacterales bacterium]|nr:MAG: DNA repair protein RecO [Desulfobacterales bacterium]
METDAIVLDTTDHADSDLIVTFFTQNAGKISAIAKGAKKSKKRFVNKLEPFSSLQIHYQQKSQNALAFLREAELQNSYYNLRCDLNLYSAASVISEFLLLGIREGSPENNIFRLTLWAMNQLDRGREAGQVLALFLVRFYDYLGYRPNLRRCTHCGKKLQGPAQYILDGETQLRCTSCRHSGYPDQRLSFGTIKLLQRAQDQPLERLHILKISGTILSEALHLLHLYGRQIFQRDIQSWQSLRWCGRVPPKPDYRKRIGTEAQSA